MADLENVSVAREPPDRQRAWVFWSTRESIENNVPSVTAIVETIVAVPLYWAVAIYFETYGVLLFALAVAPMVLLRSDKSVALGRDWFMAWEKKSWDDSRQLGELSVAEYGGVWLVGAGSAAVLCTIAYFVTRYCLIDVNTSDAIWLSAAIGWVVITAAGAGAALLAVLLAGAGMATVAAAAGVAMVFAGPIVIAGAGLVAGPAAATGAVVAVASVTIVGVVAAARPRARPIVVVIFLFPIWIGVAVAVLGVSIAIRLGATARYFTLGIRVLPKNFRRLTLCISPIEIPELVPGLRASETKFTLFLLIAECRNAIRSDDLARKLLGIALMPPMIALWFLPAWIYRITLKSTAWFWWPLAFLGSDLRHAREPILYHRRIRHSLWGRASIWLAVFSILVFVGGNFLAHWTDLPSNRLLTGLGFLVVLGWDAPPWQLLAVGTALLSLGIVFWSDYVNIEYEYGLTHHGLKNMASAIRQFGWIERVGNFRFVLVVAYWLIIAGHTVLLLNSQKCWFVLPPNVHAHALSIYGDRLPSGVCERRSDRADR